jgi:hypothetical protein
VLHAALFTAAMTQKAAGFLAIFALHMLAN